MALCRKNHTKHIQCVENINNFIFFRKNGEKRLLASSCLSVGPQETILLPLEGYLINP